MKVKEPVTLFEYDFLSNKDAKGNSEVHQISTHAYQYLKDMCLSEGEDRHLCRLRKKSGQEVLQVQSHVGVLLTPDGMQIEILPKIGRWASDLNEARNCLLIMLRTLREFKHIKTSAADTKEQKKTLLEIFITHFLQSVKHLLKHGLRRDYVPQEDNLLFCKGKLKVKAQLQKNFIQKQRFYCEYDEFLLDRPANRLLKSALKLVSKLTNDVKNQRFLKHLDLYFGDIPQSRHYPSDFAALKWERGMQHYDVPLKWSKLILEGFSPLTMKGKNRAISLLFPMEKVFESYVAHRLKEWLPEQYSLKTQVRTKHFVSHKEQLAFQLKPDLLIKEKNRVLSVLDTKWKMIEVIGKTGGYGLSQSDLYQMFAYGHYYFDFKDTSKTYEMFLIYPAHDHFKKAIEHPFIFSSGAIEKTLRLWIVPCAITKNKKDEIDWPADPEDSEKTILNPRNRSYRRNL